MRIHRAAIAAVLGVLLFTVYLVTFTGVATTDDEQYILDTTESMAVRASLQLNQTSYLRRVQTTDVEPAQPLLAAPLYWLAYHTPWVGNVHALFLFPPLVTALTAVVLYLFALELDYSEGVAIAAGMLYGLTTIAWPYTQTFFREPLSTLLVFAAAYLLVRWRHTFRERRRRHWVTLAAALIVTVLALLSKEAALIALPVLVVLAYPGKLSDKKQQRQVVIVLLAVAVVAVLFVVALIAFREQLLALGTRYELASRLVQLRRRIPDMGQGLIGYLLSPGKGIWWSSPILLLALASPFTRPKWRWRETWLMLGLTLLFVVAYSAIRGQYWSGGTGWGARYMVPLAPFLMIAALGPLEAILNSTKKWPRIVLAVLATWGLAIQLGGTTVSLLDYYDYLDASLTTPPWQGPAIWSFRWSQPIGSLLYLPQSETAIRWLQGTPDLVAIGLLLAIAGVMVVLLGTLRDEQQPVWLGTATLIGTPLIAVIFSAFTLWRAYDDPRYLADYAPLVEMRTALEADAAPEDSIVLASPTYIQHFMNYYKGRATWYSLPLAPGERPSPEQAPELEDGSLQEMAGTRASGMASTLSENGTLFNGAPIWLLSDLGPALPWATRPVEHYFSQRLYPVQTIDFSERARVVKYIPYRAPRSVDTPEQPTDALFGEAMHLTGYDIELNGLIGLPETASHGDMLGLSLLWESLTPVGADYTIAVHLVGPDGVPLQQQDRTPAGGFAPTSTWQPGEPIRDNYGFILSDDLPNGHYEVWLLAYAWPSLERLPVTSAGEASGDHLVLMTFELE
jgi:4-amino-4-deoxy-L-arabinose transferase-like glycosyltransferase